MRFLFYLSCIFSLTLPLAHAQRDTSFYRSAPIPSHLRPIERAIGSSALGSIYFYGEKRLSSPYSLEVPFFELNDPLVSHHFSAFRSWTTISRVTALVPLIYILAQPGRGSHGGYWTVYVGSIVASVGCNIIANSHVNKAVIRYNGLLRAPLRLGLSAEPVPAGAAFGVGISQRF